jgi:hypothetical protein
MVRLIWLVLAKLAHAVECGIVTENTQVHPLAGQGAGVGASTLDSKFSSPIQHTDILITCGLVASFLFSISWSKFIKEQVLSRKIKC